MNREGKDTALHLEKRIEKSKNVVVQFTDPTSFNVMDGDRIKYFGRINPDECSCDSYFYGMKFEKIGETEKVQSRYEIENGHNFQCKHIIKAKEVLSC